MDETFAELDHRVEALRAQVRAALLSGDRERARALRPRLREAEHAWHAALAAHEEDGGDALIPAGPEASPASPAGGDMRAVTTGGRGGGGVLLPLRDQVCQVLTLLT
ncbi:MAG: hypothetical protein ACLP7J_07845, partial [Streptosporangiaceae bacterium]